MNRTTVFALAALAALPVAGVVQAQQAPDSTTARPRREWRRGDRFDLAGRLVAMRAKLALSDEQVTKLTEVQGKYAELNRPIMERLRASRGDSTGWHRGPGADSSARERFRAMTPEQRSEMREKMRAERKAWADSHPEAVRDFKQLMDNHKAMRTEVTAVLTDEQRTQLKQLRAGHHQGKHGDRSRLG